MNFLRFNSDAPKLPDVEIVDDHQADGVSLTINTKPNTFNTRLPLILTAASTVPGADQLKAHWLNEINQYANDTLALHEHSVDDLRIDSTQVKPDSEYESFHLPIQRKASYESDGIRPSEVAKDHFLTEEERAFYAKQHAEDQKILEQQQKEFAEQKTRVPSTKATSEITKLTKVDTHQKEIKHVESNVSSTVTTGTTEKHAKLSRSEAIEQHSTDIKAQATEIETKQTKTIANEQRKLHEQTITAAATTAIDTKQIVAEKVNVENSATQIVKQQQQKQQVSVTEEVSAAAKSLATATVNAAATAASAAAAGKKEHVTNTQIVDSSEENTTRIKRNNHNQSVKFDIDDKNLTIASFDTNNNTSALHTNKMSQTPPTSSSSSSPLSPLLSQHPQQQHQPQQATNTPNALDMHTTAMPSSTIDTNNNADEANRCVTIATTTNTTPAAEQTPINSRSMAAAYNNNPIALAPGQRLQTISIYNFDNNNNRGGGGDDGGGGGRSINLPGFMVPSHLITYETSIEINFRKIPPPQPPPPPKFIKKLMLHTESLERRTRAFLTGNFEVGTTDSSLRTARQKIRSLKSTILKSDDEVKHAEDTIHKAQSGDFLNIFAPPIVEQPLYEFIEVPAHRSEDELSENLDRRSERSQSSVQQQQQQQEELDNMADYYSSKYTSSRSSRRRVEGKSIHFPFRSFFFSRFCLFVCLLF